MKNLLVIEDLSHSIGGRRVLDLPSWRQRVGEHALILGPSGSGKTTLINAITGLITPTGGSVTVDGRPMSSLKPAERDCVRRETIGLVFQTLRLIPALTVRQNLSLAQQVARRSTDSAEVGRLIEAVGLSQRADAKPRELSQGEAQRAAIARALATRPKLLVADEPTSALDASNAARIVKLLRDSADATGATLLIATHDDRLRAHFERTLEISAPTLQAVA